jgi:hypothetical protein
MANRRQNRKTGKFINNIVRVEDAKKYAEGYYDKHQRSIDKILAGRTNRNKKDVFVDLIEDLFDQNRSKYNNKKNLNAGIRSVIDELQGIDPRLNEIKREALNREEAGFGDLRKLNKRVSSQEIEYDGPNGIVGYYDIKNSDYVIVHRLDYTFSSKSPENVYEYELRVNVGL